MVAALAGIAQLAVPVPSESVLPRGFFGCWFHRRPPSVRDCAAGGEHAELEVWRHCAPEEGADTLHSATRPGDVYKAKNGKFVEVINTDAEGRLILADALSYSGQLGWGCAARTHLLQITWTRVTWSTLPR